MKRQYRIICRPWQYPIKEICFFALVKQAHTYKKWRRLFWRLKPIVGLRPLYHREQAPQTIHKRKDKDPRHHQVLLAKNSIGYKTLRNYLHRSVISKECIPSTRGLIKSSSINTMKAWLPQRAAWGFVSSAHFEKGWSRSREWIQMVAPTFFRRIIMLSCKGMAYPTREKVKRFY